MKRIAYVVPSLLPGGGEQHAVMLCLHLDRRRYSPALFCMLEGGQFAHKLEAGQVPFRLLAGNLVVDLGRRLLARRSNEDFFPVLSGRPDKSSRGILFRLSGRLRRSLGWLAVHVAELISAIHLYAILIRGHYDLVSAHVGVARSAIWAGRLAGIPVVWTEGGQIETPMYRKSTTLALRALVPLVSRMIVPSRSVLNSVVRQLSVDPKRIVQVEHSVLFPIPAMPRPEPTQAPPVILTIGRLRPEKGHAVLYNALGLLKKRGTSFHCVIAGDGPEREALMRLAAALDLSPDIEHLGSIDNDLVPGLLANAALLAVPSLSEGYGIMALEAMICGVPVVGTAVDGLNELVKHGETGILVPPSNPAALAVALELVLTNASLRGLLGEAGWRRAQLRVPARIVDATCHVYDELLKSSCRMR